VIDADCVGLACKPFSVKIGLLLLSWLGERVLVDEEEEEEAGSRASTTSRRDGGKGIQLTSRSQKIRMVGQKRKVLT